MSNINDVHPNHFLFIYYHYEKRIIDLQTFITVPNVWLCIVPILMFNTNYCGTLWKHRNVVTTY